MAIQIAQGGPLRLVPHLHCVGRQSPVVTHDWTSLKLRCEVRDRAPNYRYPPGERSSIQSGALSFAISPTMKYPKNPAAKPIE